MIPTAFDQETRVVGPPLGMTEDQVHSLSIADVVCDGRPAIVSCWKMTVAERAEFERTGRIWLLQYGSIVMPHCLTATSPFATPEADS